MSDKGEFIGAAISVVASAAALGFFGGMIANDPVACERRGEHKLASQIARNEVRVEWTTYPDGTIGSVRIVEVGKKP